MVFRVGELAAEGVGAGCILLPEGPGQAAGEEAQQAQGQYQEEEAEDRGEDCVQGRGQEGHLGAKRAVRCSLHNPVHAWSHLASDAHSKGLGQWLVTWLCPRVNLWGLASEG